MEGMKMEPGRILAGKYEVQRILGEGAGGIVYLAWDRNLRRHVAVKKQKQNINDNGVSFEREIMLLKELRHPMLPVLFDYFLEGDRYLIMEYIEGGSLHNYINETGQIEERQALSWAIEIAELLCYLHNRKPAVIYRDLKPDNILVCPDGKIRLIDFGAAYYRQGAGDRDKILAGTTGYAAPEQLCGMSGKDGYSDERSDIYTFGTTLYHMLTGHDPSKPPYGLRPIRCMNPKLSSGMERFVERCTMAQPTLRFQTMEEILRELERLKKHPNSMIGKRNRKYHGYSYKGPVLKKLERKIWLTQKQGSGLWELWILLGTIFAAGVFFTAAQLGVVNKSVIYETSMGETAESEALFSMTIYNDLGQKILLRKDSVYKPQGNLILELEQENYALNHLQMVSVSLTDCYTGMRQERVFYIRGK